MPGVLVVDLRSPFGALLDELVYFIETSEDGEWSNEVVFIRPQ
jgi:hypothetical protein